MWWHMARFFLPIFAILTIITAARPIYLYAGSKCSLNNGHMGVCRSVNSCPSAVRELQHHHMHTHNDNRGGYPRCGFDSFTEIVCCPETDNIQSFEPGDDSYQFPDGESGNVTPIPSISIKTGDIRKADKACDDYSKEVPSPLDLYILGGEAAKQGEFPHMAALGYAREKATEFDCGGSLISPLYVLTAAHCVVTLEGIKPSVVRIGTISLSDSFDSADNDYKVENIIVHPSYTRALKYNDIALIKLARPVPYTGDAHPACLYTIDNDPPGRLIVTGWGQTSLSLSDTRSKTLLKANLTVVSLDECNPTYLESKNRKLPKGVTSEQLCAVDRGGTMDACTGDSGGPLQIATNIDGMYKVIGVTSFGNGCGGAIPAIYVRVSKYIDWIESVVWP